MCFIEKSIISTTAADSSVFFLLYIVMINNIKQLILFIYARRLIEKM